MNVKNKVDLRNGSALLLSLFLLVALSMILASYLYLVGTESKITQRSLDWNAAIPAAEAGVEEALTALYYGTNTLATSYWAVGGDGMYHKTRMLPDGSKYSTAILASTVPVVIWSTGYVAAPFSTNTYIRRLVKVGAVKSPSRGGGIVGNGNYTIQGGSKIDAYDSANGPYSTNTVIPNGAKVLTISTNKPAITVQGGAIVNGGLSVGIGGTVNNSGSVSGTIASDANVQITDNTVPPLGSYFTSFTAFGTTNIAGTAGSPTTYQMATINISSSGAPLIINGDVTIYCTQTGNNVVRVQGSGYIYISPGASLKIYSAGQVIISGSGVVNADADTTKMSIFGLPTCTSVQLSGNSDFYGVINAPEAAFTFTGGVTMNAYGSFVVNSATISGTLHFNITGGPLGYIVQNWNELPVN